MDGPIASAVMLPEPEPEETNEAQHTPLSPAGQKRRQSLVADHDSKRPRLNSIDANANGNQERRPSLNSRDGTSTAAPARRERGRERRLFGSVLGALSQNPTSTAQKKRAEIEKRQRERRVQEAQEDDQRKAERAALRRVQRQKEQKQFERETMRVRHNQLVAQAHFLQTKAEPRLYYKPWETTEDEDDIIRDQITEAEDTIRQELDEAGIRRGEDKGQEREREREPSRHTGNEEDAGAKDPIGKELADAQHAPSNDATNFTQPPPNNAALEEHDTKEATLEATNGAQAAEPEQQHSPTTPALPAEEQASKEAPEDNGEEVVEAAEDTVIY